jgi:hypothetical protein
VNTAIRARLLLALAFVGLAALGALLAPKPVPVMAVRASHGAPVPTAATPGPTVTEGLRTDI